MVNFLIPEDEYPSLLKDTFGLLWSLRWERDATPRVICNVPQAAMLGNIQMVKRFFQLEMFDPEEKAYDKSALCCAVLGRNEQIVRTLLEAGALPSIEELKATACIGHEEMFNHFVGLMSTKELPSFSTLREQYLERYHFQVMQNAEHLSIPKEEAEKLKWPKLIYAEREELERQICANLSHTDLKPFLDCESTVEPSRKLMINSAIEFGHIEIAETLLENGANVDGIEPYGKHNPLYRAVVYGSWDGVQLLLEKGADVSICGTDALESSAGKGDAEFVKLLLEAGANPNPKRRHPYAQKGEPFWKGIARQAQGPFSEEIGDLLEQAVGK